MKRTEPAPRDHSTGFQEDRAGSGMSSSDFTYFCPRCGGDFIFSSEPEFRAHLVNRHTYETLLLLSQARGRRTRPGPLIPLPDSAESQRVGSSPGLEPLSLPRSLAGLELIFSSTSIRLLREMRGLPHHGFPGLDVVSEHPGSSCAPVLPRTVDPFAKEKVHELWRFGLCPVQGVSVEIGLEERLGLGLDLKIRRMYAEVEDGVKHHIRQLKVELQKREAELEEERRASERLKGEKCEVELRAADLSRQVSAAMAMMDGLKKDVEEKDKELRERQQEMLEVHRFLRAIAQKEVEAKTRLKVFMETLLERAERAERRLLLLSSHAHKNPRTHSDPDHRHTPEPGSNGRSMDAGDIIRNRMQETISNKRSYSVSGSYEVEAQLFDRHHSGLTARMRTLSLGSGGWNSDRWWVCEQPWSQVDQQRLWVEDKGWSTEEEELWSASEMTRISFTRTNRSITQGNSSSRHLTPPCCHGDTLRLRAGLFCVFPYLDVQSLLCAAEVCSDWRFVARHPAVWTRLHLENVRVSSQFLSTLSQWCTQTQSVVLNNLKSRVRRADETPEDYLSNTRGILELGVEAVLRSAGGSLLHMCVCECPDVLTDRTLWLLSCYCRNLVSLTYRSSSDPVRQEVLWALGAGCRNISSLKVAPLHPCQQPARCLQTIGRCWPHLRVLSMGGAKCGTQGLVAVARSCPNLQVLELECVADLGLQVATELCKVGLKNLETLILTHTPVSGQAVLHFHKMCANLRSIVVEASAQDYFEDLNTPEAGRLFGEILSTLKVLQKRPGLCDVLQVKAEGFC